MPARQLIGYFSVFAIGQYSALDVWTLDITLHCVTEWIYVTPNRKKCPTAKYTIVHYTDAECYLTSVP